MDSAGVEAVVACVAGDLAPNRPPPKRLLEAAVGAAVAVEDAASGLGGWEKKLPADGAFVVAVVPMHGVSRFGTLQNENTKFTCRRAWLAECYM